MQKTSKQRGQTFRDRRNWETITNSLNDDQILQVGICYTENGKDGAIALYTQFYRQNFGTVLHRGIVRARVETINRHLNK